MVHAITVTLVRLAITRHRLLEWETAAASADRHGPPRLSVFAKEMIASPLIALGGLALVILIRPGRAARSDPDRRPVGGGAVDRVLPQPAGADPPGGARPGRPRVPPVGGAQDLALFRHLRRPRGSRAPARQRPARPGPDDRAPHVADQHRDGTARDPRGSRLRVHRHRWLDGADSGHAHDHRKPGTLRGAPAELVRHPHAGAAGARLHLDRRQRQPRGCAAGAVGGVAAAVGGDRRRRRGAGATCSTIWPGDPPRWSMG